MPKAVTLSELVRWYPYSTASWLKWLKAGLLPGARKIGGEWHVPLAAAEALMEARGPKLVGLLVAGLDREQAKRDRRALDRALAAHPTIAELRARAAGNVAV
jgi:hypothetical protein